MEQSCYKRIKAIVLSSPRAPLSHPSPFAHPSLSASLVLLNETATNNPCRTTSNTTYSCLPLSITHTLTSQTNRLKTLIFTVRFSTSLEAAESVRNWWNSLQFETVKSISSFLINSNIGKPYVWKKVALNTFALYRLIKKISSFVLYLSIFSGVAQQDATTQMRNFQYFRSTSTVTTSLTYN